MHSTSANLQRLSENTGAPQTDQNYQKKHVFMILKRLKTLSPMKLRLLLSNASEIKTVKLQKIRSTDHWVFTVMTPPITTQINPSVDQITVTKQPFLHDQPQKHIQTTETSMTFKARNYRQNQCFSMQWTILSFEVYFASITCLLSGHWKVNIQNTLQVFVLLQFIYLCLQIFYCNLSKFTVMFAGM